MKLHKTIHRLLAIVLALNLSLGLVNVTALAADQPEGAERTLVCGKEEHTHDATCYTGPVLVCGQEESEGHTHGDACYEVVKDLSCGMDETEGHTHTDDCYEEVEVTADPDAGTAEDGEALSGTERRLICGQEEVAPHHHTDECYTVTKQLTCGMEASEGHTHTDACYKSELTCELEEHTHTEECYMQTPANDGEGGSGNDEGTSPSCDHIWEEGKCSKCSAVCEHESRSEDGTKCDICDMSLEPAEVPSEGSNGPSVCEINGTGYETLSAAFAAVQEGETIILKQDITESATIKDKGSFTLDLQNHTITSTAPKTLAIYPKGDSTIVIKNGSLNGNNSGHYAMEITKNAGSSGNIDVSLEELNISNYNPSISGEAVLNIASMRSVNIKNCVIRDNRFQSYVVRAEGVGSKTTINIIGSTFEGNTGAESSPTTVYINCPTINIEGSRFVNNKAGEAGALHISKNSDLQVTISNTVIKGNHAFDTKDDSHNTGGIYVDGKDLTIESSTIYNNTRGTNSTPSDIYCDWVESLLPASEMTDDGTDFSNYLWRNVASWVEGWEVIEYKNGITSKDMTDVGGKSGLNLAAVEADGESEPAVPGATTGTLILKYDFEGEEKAVNQVKTKLVQVTITPTINGSATKAFLGDDKTNRSMTLENVKPGNYSISSATSEKNITVSNYNVTIEGEGEYEVKAGRTTEVMIKYVYTSNSPVSTGTLKLTNIIKGECPEAENKPYTFSITNGTDTNIIKTLKVTGAGEATIDLATGAYSLKAADGTIDGYWYSVDPPEISFTVTKGNTTPVSVTYTYGEDDKQGPIARIDETEYTSLQRAMDVADDGDTIEILKDMIINSTIEVNKDVTLTSADGSFTITRGPSLVQTGTASTTTKADNMFLVENGSLILQNITLDGGSESGIKPKNSIILVENGGTLKIFDKAVLQNNDCQDSTYQTGLGGLVPDSSISHNGGAVLCLGNMVMTGGEIKNCKANNGGGVMILTTTADKGATFEMRGGIISGNTADATDSDYTFNVGSGGGVCLVNASTMTFTGEATISGNTAGVGGGISVGTEASTNRSGSVEYHLYMSGGKIDRNEADGNGGGIFIAGAGFSALIEGGDITNNVCTKDKSSYNSSSRTALYGGGGIYVHGDTGTTGRVRILNVKISDNTADMQGGGVAGCPSSSVGIYITKGGMIYDNPASDGSQVYVIRDKSSTPYVSLSPTMLGGGAYNWQNTDGTLMTPEQLNVTLSDLHTTVTAKSAPTADDISKGAVEVTTNITGNVSHANGGGVGTNGRVEIGIPDEKDETVSVWVQKLWEGDIGSGKNLPTFLRFDLYRDGELIGNAEMKPRGGGINAWLKNPVELFKGLLKYDPIDKHEYEYTVEEEGVKGYIGTVVPGETNDKEKPWVFTNTYVGGTSLTVSKTVTGTAGDTNKDFHFTVQLSDKRISGIYGQMTFTNGVATFTLKHGQSKSASGLPESITYEVTETEANTDGYTTSSEGATGPIADGKTATATFTNSKDNPPPPPSDPTGSLTIQKAIVGGGSEAANKTYTFTVDGPNGYSATVEITGAGSKTLTGLTPGTYTITETGADIDGWDLTVSGDTEVTLKAGKNDATITNTYTEQVGSLQISKELAGGGTAAAEKVFTFDVTGPDGYSATVEITGAGTATLNNLKHGEYTVTERDAQIDGYTWSVQSDGSATVEKGGQTSVTVTNTYTKIEGSLQITKNIVGGGTAAAEKVYTFDVTGPNGYSGTVTVTGAGTATLEDLEPGEYTITEQDASIEGYTLEVTGDTTATVTDDGNTAQATVTNTYTPSEGTLTITKRIGAAERPRLRRSTPSSSPVLKATVRP